MSDYARDITQELHLSAGTAACCHQQHRNLLANNNTIPRARFASQTPFHRSALGRHQRQHQPRNGPRLAARTLGQDPHAHLVRLALPPQYFRNISSRFVDKLPTGAEAGGVLALDLGGTNYRSAGTPASTTQPLTAIALHHAAILLQLLIERPYCYNFSSNDHIVTISHRLTPPPQSSALPAAGLLQNRRINPGGPETVAGAGGGGALAFSFLLISVLY
jgi:hypothetical protein